MKMTLGEVKRVVREVLAGGKYGPADSASRSAQSALAHYTSTGDEESRAVAERNFRYAGMPDELVQQVMSLADEMWEIVSVDGFEAAEKTRRSMWRTVNAWVKASGFTMYR